MKILPVPGPGAIQDKSTPEHVRTSKAIAAFNRGQSSHDNPSAVQGQQQAQQHPVRNPSQVSPEEMSVVRGAQPDPDLGPEIPQPADNISNIEAQEETPQSPSPKEDPKLASQYAQLAKRERAIRQRQIQHDQALKAREQALIEREQALTAKDQEYAQGYIPRERLKQQTLDTLAEAGISYEDLTQQLLNQPNRDPRVESVINELRSEIKSLKQANEDNKKSQENSQLEARKQAVNQIRTEVKSLVMSDPEFETVRKTNSINDVVELIERTFDKDGILLSVEDAAKEVEDYLIEESMSLYNNVSKIKKRLQGSVQTPQRSQQVAQTPQQRPQQTQGMKTLTNATSTPRQMTARERAMAAFKGELK